MAGNGLKFLIKAESNCAYDWMSFALYYSLIKSLPDVEVISENKFNWAHKLKIYCHLRDDYIILNPATMALKELTDEQIEKIVKIKGVNDPELCSEVKENKFTPFISYNEGIGNFVLSEWIDKSESPLSRAESFIVHSCNANELKVFRLWKQSSHLYNFLQRW